MSMAHTSQARLWVGTGLCLVALLIAIGCGSGGRIVNDVNTPASKQHATSSIS
jgi:hypothetical protein